MEPSLGFSLRATEALVETLTVGATTAAHSIVPRSDRDRYLIDAVRDEAERERRRMMLDFKREGQVRQAVDAETAASLRSTILASIVGESRAAQVEAGRKRSVSAQIRCKVERGALRECLRESEGLATCARFVEAFESCAKRAQL